MGAIVLRLDLLRSLSLAYQSLLLSTPLQSLSREDFGFWCCFSPPAERRQSPPGSAGCEFWSDFSKAGDAGAGGLQGQGQNLGRSSLRALQACLCWWSRWKLEPSTLSLNISYQLTNPRAGQTTFLFAKLISTVTNIYWAGALDKSPRIQRHRICISGENRPLMLPYPCLLWVTSKKESCTIVATPRKGAEAWADRLTAVTIRAISVFNILLRKKYHVESGKPTLTWWSCLPRLKQYDETQKSLLIPEAGE